MECIRPGRLWNQLSVYGHNRVYAASYRVYTASCRVYTASYNVYTASNRVYTATNRVYTATECMRPKMVISMCFASVWCECIRPRCRKYGIPISFHKIIEKTRGLRVDENDLKSSGDPIRWKVTIFICLSLFDASAYGQGDKNTKLLYIFSRKLQNARVTIRWKQIKICRAPL